MPFITLHVGKDNTIFHVHEDTLFQASSVFKTAFNSNFREASQRTMTLPDDDAKLFGVFDECLYTQTFCLDLVCPMETHRDMQAGYTQAARLFVLADKYDAEMIKISIYRDFFRNARSSIRNDSAPLPNKDVVSFIYTHTDRRAPFRRILTDWFVWSEKSNWGFKNASMPRMDWMYDVPDLGVDLAMVLGSRGWERYDKGPFVVCTEDEYLGKILRKS